MIAKEVKYKKTGNEWVPEIPEHWEILKAKNIGYFEGSTVDKKTVKHDKMVRIVNFMDIYDNETFEITEDVDFMKVSATEHQIKNLKVNIGDVVFTPSSEVREDIGKSAVVKYSADDLLFSYHVSRLKFTREIDINFKKYLFNNKPVLKYFSKNCKGSTRKILNRIEFKNLPIYLPPIEEQKIIANFLDERSTKISHFIQTKKRFIELLKEQRQSIINHAVTKGINPNAKMKSSGVEWLGDVPEHWEVRRLGTIGRFSKGGNISRAELIYSDDGVPAILYGDIYTKYDIKADKIINKISNETANESVELKIGDLLFTGSGETKEDIGKCILFSSDVRAYAGGDVIIFKQEIFDSYFISYSQNSSIAKHQKAISSKGEIIVHTYGSKLRDVIMPYPPIEEQKIIIQHIIAETQTIDTAISKAEREIELIKEYKEAMIAEAVMGKMNN